MKGKTVPSILMALGALLIIAGLVVKYAIVPTLAKFPEDVDETRVYAGTVDILNRAELESPSGNPLFFTGLPVVSNRTVKVEETDGDKALVRDTADLVAAPGTPIEGLRLTGSDELFTIDRKTMEAIDNFTGNDQVISSEGLVIGWPIDTEARDYTGWNGDPGQTVTLEYAGQEEREGRDTYVFTASSGPLPIIDPATLAEFPAALPKAAIEPIAASGALDLPPEILAGLGQALPLLPDQLPLSYTYEFEARYWVDPDTGVLIDVEKHDVRKAVLSGLPIPIEPVVVYNLNYSATDQAKADAVEDADDYGRQLVLGRTTAPIALWVIGGLLALAGAFYFWRNSTEESVPRIRDDG